MTLLLSYLIGCRTVNQINTDLRTELLACQSLEIASFPDNSLLSRFLARIDGYAVSDIQSVSQVLLDAHGLAQNLAGIVLVDLDSTGLVVTGDQFELAESGYFAKNRGAIGYQLNLATASNTGGEVLVNILDPGNTMFDEYLSGWVGRVHKLLEWAQRTSSAVENVNGILKSMIKRKKRFSNSQNLEVNVNVKVPLKSWGSTWEKKTGRLY